MVGWQNQETVFLVMYKSRKSGGTYTEVRRTQAGLKRLLDTLNFFGYDKSDIIVMEQQKAWMPEKKTKKGKIKNAKKTLY